MSSTTAEIYLGQIKKTKKPVWRRDVGATAFATVACACVLSAVAFRGYIYAGIERIIYTPEERAEIRAVESMFSHIQMVRVACAPGGNQQEWMAYAATKGWPVYAPAGTGCFSPNRKIDRSDLVNFIVACPATPFNAADQQRWERYAANLNWGPYPQAGAACVDP